MYSPYFADIISIEPSLFDGQVKSFLYVLTPVSVSCGQSSLAVYIGFESLLSRRFSKSSNFEKYSSISSFFGDIVCPLFKPFVKR